MREMRPQAGRAAEGRPSVTHTANGTEPTRADAGTKHGAQEAVTVARDNPPGWVSREGLRPLKETREAQLSSGTGQKRVGPSCKGDLALQPAGWQCADTELSGGV